MKKTRTHLLLLAGAAALMLAGCGRDEPEVTVEISPEARSLLAHVPADTPYLAGNLAALPDEIIDLQFQRYAPVTAEAQRMLDDLQAGVLSAKMKHITEWTDQRIAWAAAAKKCPRLLQC